MKLVLSKTVFVSLALLFTGSIVFAQKAEEDPEKLLKMYIQEYNENANKFYKSHLSEDFRYINVKGKFVTRDETLKSSEGRKSIQSHVSDLKIFTEGNLSVISGIHSYEGYKVAFTFTSVKKDGKWFLAASQNTLVEEDKK